MKYAVFGLGNLGTDILLNLRQRGENVEGFKTFSETLPFLQNESPQTLFCCIGSGGPNDSLEAFRNHLSTNVIVTLDLLRCRQRNTRLVFFSTHYLNHDVQGKCSGYGLTKSLLENVCHNQPNVAVYRIGSLYGAHYPQKTFINKVIENSKNKDFIELPINYVTPTPTAWLAEHVIKIEETNDEEKRSIGPFGKISVRLWGEKIIRLAGLKTIVRGKEVDENYPEYSSAHPYDRVADQFKDDHWQMLWVKYGEPLITRQQIH